MSDLDDKIRTALHAEDAELFPEHGGEQSMFEMVGDESSMNTQPPRSARPPSSVNPLSSVRSSSPERKRKARCGEPSVLVQLIIVCDGPLVDVIVNLVPASRAGSRSTLPGPAYSPGVATTAAAPEALAASIAARMVLQGPSTSDPHVGKSTPNDGETNTASAWSIARVAGDSSTSWPPFDVTCTR